MKPTSFDYARPDTLAEAVSLMVERDDPQVLAGGQSLIPALNFRLGTPGCLVDINRIAELRGIDESEGEIKIRALVRHAEVARSALIEKHAPLIAQAMHHVAHPAIRNRGTTCGSLAYGDPASEMPACAVALDAVMVLRSYEGDRMVRARDFYRGLYETARRGDEILTEMRVRKATSDEFFAFDEVARRHGDFAMVGIALRGRMQNDLISELDLVVFGSEPTPHICREAQRLAVGQKWSDVLVLAIAETVAKEIDPMGNLQGRAETKRKQASALVRRVLSRTMEKLHACS